MKKLITFVLLSGWLTFGLFTFAKDANFNQKLQFLQAKPNVKKLEQLIEQYKQLYKKADKKNKELIMERIKILEEKLKRIKQKYHIQETLTTDVNDLNPNVKLKIDKALEKFKGKISRLALDKQEEIVKKVINKINRIKERFVNKPFIYKVLNYIEFKMKLFLQKIEEQKAQPNVDDVLKEIFKDF